MAMGSSFSNSRSRSRKRPPLRFAAKDAETNRIPSPRGFYGLQSPHPPRVISRPAQKSTSFSPSERSVLISSPQYSIKKRTVASEIFPPFSRISFATNAIKSLPERGRNSTLTPVFAPASRSFRSFADFLAEISPGNSNNQNSGWIGVRYQGQNTFRCLFGRFCREKSWTTARIYGSPIKGSSSTSAQN